MRVVDIRNKSTRRFQYTCLRKCNSRKQWNKIIIDKKVNKTQHNNQTSYFFISKLSIPHQIYFFLDFNDFAMHHTRKLTTPSFIEMDPVIFEQNFRVTAEVMADPDIREVLLQAT